MLFKRITYWREQDHLKRATDRHLAVTPPLHHPHHNEIRDELIYMAGKAMTPSARCDEPLIRPGYVAEKQETMACPTIGMDLK
jgi:hypothetical protein